LINSINASLKLINAHFLSPSPLIDAIKFRPISAGRLNFHEKLPVKIPVDFIVLAVQLNDTTGGRLTVGFKVPIRNWNNAVTRDMIAREVWLASQGRSKDKCSEHRRFSSP
jgi:hypothetical protein